jgi:hypothetical protein
MHVVCKGKNLFLLDSISNSMLIHTKPTDATSPCSQRSEQRDAIADGCTDPTNANDDSTPRNQ